MFTSLAATGATVAQYVLGGFLIALAIIVVIVVLMQSGKERGLSGTISGTTETYFGKAGGNSKDKLLSKLTIILSIVFVIAAIALSIVVLRANSLL